MIDNGDVVGVNPYWQTVLKHNQDVRICFIEELASLGLVAYGRTDGSGSSAGLSATWRISWFSNAGPHFWACVALGAILVFIAR